MSKGLKCEKCNSTKNKVIDTRSINNKIKNCRYRRRECLECNHRFNTYEYIENSYQKIIFEYVTGVEKETEKNICEYINKTYNIKIDTDKLRNYRDKKRNKMFN